jgi:cytidyltransferase-like protein
MLKLNFKQFFKRSKNQPYKIIEEAINLKDFKTEKETKPASIYNGRFQPFTLGHKSFIEQMKKDNPKNEIVIVLIKGGKSSLQLDKNPFSEKEQINFILKSTKDLGIKRNNIIIAENSYILTIVEAVRKKGFEPDVMYAGPDRINGYNKMLDSMIEIEGDSDDKVLKTAFNLDIEYLSGESDGTTRVKASNGKEISASLVRQSIMDDNFEDFKLYTYGYTLKDFKLMQEKIAFGLKDAKEKAIQKKIDSTKKKIEKAKTEKTKTKNENILKELEKELAEI